MKRFKVTKFEEIFDIQNSTVQIDELLMSKLREISSNLWHSQKTLTLTETKAVGGI